MLTIFSKQETENKIAVAPALLECKNRFLFPACKEFYYKEK